MEVRGGRKKRKREVTAMTELVVALVIAVPVILFPAALIWYLNIGGITQAVREAHQKTATVKVTK